MSSRQCTIQYHDLYSKCGPSIQGLWVHIIIRRPRLNGDVFFKKFFGFLRKINETHATKLLSTSILRFCINTSLRFLLPFFNDCMIVLLFVYLNFTLSLKAQCLFVLRDEKPPIQMQSNVNFPVNDDYIHRGSAQISTYVRETSDGQSPLIPSQMDISREGGGSFQTMGPIPLFDH